MIPYLSTFIGLVIISMIKTKKDASAKKMIRSVSHG